MTTPEARSKDDELREQIGWLSQIGVNFKFGKGVVGKACVVVGLFVPVFLAVAIKLPSTFGATIAFTVLLMLFIVGFLVFVFGFAKKFPAVSLLEGGQLLSGLRLEKAKGRGALPESPLIANPEIPPISASAIIEHDRPDEAASSPEAKSPTEPSKEGTG